MESADQPGRIAVDLVPIQRGGINGGIKSLTLNFLTGLAERGWSVTCFCNPSAYEEVRALLPETILLETVPPSVELGLRYDQVAQRDGRFDLNYFPMQRVSIVRSDCATVSAIMDVQFADIPQNFNAVDRIERERAFRDCIEHSDRIIAISNFTRSRIVALSDYPADRVDVIHIAPPMPVSGDDDPLAVLEHYRVKSDSYLLYPANFWAHKNHDELIAAFLLARDRGGVAAKLLLTGDAGSPLGKRIAAATSACDDIVLAGFVGDTDLAILMAHARAVVFPSSYEGFGMPMIEAMMLDRPVAAAWSTCIPEVVNRAALLFDQTCREAMASAIVRIVSDENLRRDLVQNGRRRVAELGTHKDMIDRYEQAFHKAISASRAAPALPEGIHPDGWAGQDIIFHLPSRRRSFELELGIRLPSTAPFDFLQISTEVDGQDAGQAVFWNGGSYRLRQSFGKCGGRFRLRCNAAFRPTEWGLGADSRPLAYKVTRARLRMGGIGIDLLQPKSYSESFADLRNAVIAIDCEMPEGNRRLVTVAVPVEKEQREVVIESVQPILRLTTRTSATGAVCDIQLPPDLNNAGPQVTDPDELLVSLRASAPLRPTAIAPRPGGALPGFSVVIPSFNQGCFIGRTIASVLEQDGVRDVHVFDGGSTDETVDILSGFGGSIRWVSQADNGQADAVNKGMAAASGQFIAWINSDDIFEQDAFAHVSDIFERHPEVGVVYGEAYHIDEADAVIERYPTEDFDLDRLYQRCFICQPAAFFRRELVERYGGLRESLHYCLDYEFWLRLAQAGVSFHRTEKFLASSRYYDQNKTVGSRPQAYFETTDLMLRALGRPGGDWMVHFANAIADHLVRRAGISRITAFQHAERLARHYWGPQ